MIKRKDEKNMKKADEKKRNSKKGMKKGLIWTKKDIEKMIEKLI